MLQLVLTASGRKLRLQLEMYFASVRIAFMRKNKWNFGVGGNSCYLLYQKAKYCDFNQHSPTATWASGNRPKTLFFFFFFSSLQPAILWKILKLLWSCVLLAYCLRLHYQNTCSVFPEITEKSVIDVPEKVSTKLQF